MDHDFWLTRWEQGQTRFHVPVAHPLLVAHLGALRLAPGARLFLPLCGKTLDIGWLRAQGFRVAGAELSPLAVALLFEALDERPEVADLGPIRRLRVRDVEVFQGDIFALTAAMLGPVDAVYDRAALIALPPDLRRRYAAQLIALTEGAPQLLLGLAGMPDPGAGPPFQVAEPEVRALYGHAFRILHLADVPDRERSGGTDQVWLLERPAA